MQYLTPDDNGGIYVCRRLRFRAEQASYISGALELLTKVEVWEAFGTMSPSEIADLMTETLNDYLDGGDMCRIGTVCEYITENPPNGVLPLDGTTYDGSDYPELYAAIAAVFDNGDGTFTLPDARGRAAVGAGSGSGLTARTMGDVFGTETHQLTTGEMPAHVHTDTITGITAADPLVGVPLPVASVATPSATGSAGGDGAHNNIQPSIAWSMGVWYK